MFSNQHVKGTASGSNICFNYFGISLKRDFTTPYAGIHMMKRWTALSMTLIVGVRLEIEDQMRNWHV